MGKPTFLEQLKSARDRLAAGSLKVEEFDELIRFATGSCSQSTDRTRQRLLYLHAGSPSIRSNLIGHALHEPLAESKTQIDPCAPEIPYNCVHDAILDGWRVIHFPQQLAPFEDREIDIMGYEFILEKLEDCYE